MNSAEMAKLRGTAIGRTSILSGLTIIKYKPKMKQWPLKSLEGRFFKKPMLLFVHVEPISVTRQFQLTKVTSANDR